MDLKHKENEGAVWSGMLEIELPPTVTMAVEIEWPTTLTSPPTLAYDEGETPGSTRIEIYFDGPPDAAAVAALIAALSSATGTPVAPPDFSPLPEKDWIGFSQTLRQPVEAGRYIVFGAHDRDKIDPAKIGIEIEAGQAFGTGQHESTKGCLMALDWLADREKPANALDLGTGSGVLAMAAWCTWNIPVFATEIDDIATQTARANVFANDIPVRIAGEDRPGIALLTSDGFDAAEFADEQPFDLIIANILAGPLADLAPDMARHSPAGGWLILSGLLEEQAGELRDAFESAGFAFERDFRLGLWSTLIMRRGERG